MTRKDQVPLAPQDLGSLGAGDSYLFLNLLPIELAEVAFQQVKEEVKWDVMFHRGGEVPRLVAVQGDVKEDGSTPLYRHPADQSPRLRAFTPAVQKIRETIETILRHPVNHVLIQHYRSGKDNISEHSDKTIDVVRGSNIVNVSLGAQRNMTLRTKKDQLPPREPEREPDAERRRRTQRFPLPHNSMFVMGPQTNSKWLHAINADNRPWKTKSLEEQDESGERISLTFRHIGTYLTADEALIYGQGAKGKTLSEANPVVRGGPEAEGLIIAFGAENHQSDFDWERYYGHGFDVLHFAIVDGETSVADPGSSHHVQ